MTRSRFAADLSSKILPIVCAAIGAGGALICTALLAPDSAAADAKQEPGPELDPERLSALERSVLALGNRTLRAGSAAPSDGDPNVPAASDPVSDQVMEELPLLTEEEGRAQGAQERRVLLERHEAEPVDSTWAPHVEDALIDDFAHIAQRARRLSDDISLDVVDVSCKSSMCRIRVEWASYDAALLAAGDMASHAFQENCPVWVLVPEPDSLSSESAYQHDVVLDCGDQG